MLKRLLFTFLGFALSVGGFILAYIGLLGVEKDGNMLLLIPAVFLIGGGIFLLYKAGRMEGSKLKFKELSGVLQSQGETVLDRNNKMAVEWDKTNNTKDKLKAAQVGFAAGVEESGGK